MGSMLSLECERDENGNGDAKTPLLLNVYDLTNQNDYMYWCGVGIYHSGIEGRYLFYCRRIQFQNSVSSKKMQMVYFFYFLY